MNSFNIVIDKIKELIEKIARIPSDEISLDENLIELGADSILLMNMNAGIKGEFGVDIPINLYFEELTTVQSIADYIQKHIDKSYFAVKKSAGQSNTTKNIQPESSISNNIANNSISSIEVSNDVMLLFEKQLKIMKEQLNLLGADSCMLDSTILSQNENIKTNNDEPEVELSQIDNKDEDTNLDTKPYVAHKPIDLSKKKTTEEQDICLNNLIKEYTAKTQNSKKYIEKHRKHYADQRNVAGFRRNTKEMMYQLIFESSNGAYITDIDGNEYIDLAMDFGVSLLGHNQDFINDAIQSELNTGYPLSLISKLTGEVAEKICKLTGLDRATFFNSGTEAVMAGVRVARAHTGKNKVVIFAGSYHGSSDGLLGMTNWSDPMHGAIPVTVGITEGMVSELFILEYGAEESLQFIQEHSHEIAAVLTESVQSRNPGLRPKEFLLKLRDITANNDICLIFDEMITGFRLGKRGAQGYYGISADLVTYGKICGGGMPIGVLAGKEEVMESLDGGLWNYGDDSVPPGESKRTFVAGTFSHHPLTMAAAKAVLTKIDEEGEDIFPVINQRTKYLCETLNDYFYENDIPIEMVYCASLFRFVLKGNMEIFYNMLLLEGIYVWEGRNCFISLAHDDEIIEKIIAGIQKASMKMLPFFPKKKETKKSNLFSLTKEQEKMLAIESAGIGQEMFRESFMVEIKGNVKLEKLQEALKRVVKRHDVLCSVISEDYTKIIKNNKADILINHIKSDDDINDILKKNVSLDIVKGPILYIALIDNIVESEEKRYLYFCANHILIDGWSLSVIYQEMVGIYNHLLQGTKLQLNKPLSYFDYLSDVKKQCQDLDKWEIEDYVDYYFNNIEWKMPLPASAYGCEETTKGKRHTFKIDSSKIERIRKCAAKEKTSAFMLLLAVFQMTLREITGQDNVAVGIPIAGQMKYPLNALVGNCIKMRPVSVDLDINRNVFDIIENDKKAFKTFDYLNDIQPVEIDEKYDNINADINVVFNMDKIPVMDSLYDTEVKWIPIQIGEVKYDLFMNICDFGDEYVIEVDYSWAKFSETIVDRWSNLFIQILDEVIAKPKKKLEEMNLITEYDIQSSEQSVSERNLNEINDNLGNVISDRFLGTDIDYICIKDAENRPVITGSYGFLYVGSNNLVCFNTGWIARIDEWRNIEILGAEDKCLSRDGSWISLYKLEKNLCESDYIKRAQLEYKSNSRKISANIELADLDTDYSEVIHDIINRIPNNMLPDNFYLGEFQKSEFCISQKLEFITNSMTDTQMKVYDKVCSIIGDKTFLPETNLFSLGINSLKLIVLINSIHEIYNNVYISYSMLSENLTVNYLAEIIDEQLKNNTGLPIFLERAEQKEWYKASMPQKRLFLINHINSGAIDYNIPSVVKIDGELDYKKLEDAFGQCIEKHAILNAVFQEKDGDIYYKISDGKRHNIEIVDRSECSDLQNLIVQELNDFVKPFDLENGPLYRAKILRVADKKHLMLMDFHHIIFDGMSSFVLGNEIKYAYENGDLKPAEYSYMDYTKWREKIQHDTNYINQEKYWKSKFETPVSKLDIMTDFPRKKHPMRTVGICTNEFDENQAADIISFCKEHKITPFSFFVAALNIALSQYTYENDITIGTAVHGRNSGATQNLIGMFVNTLPIRNIISSEVIVSEFLDTTHKNNMQCFANAEIDFEHIVDIAKESREENRNPLFDVMIAYEDFGDSSFSIDSMEVSFEETIAKTARFDMEIRVINKGNRIEIKNFYADELYLEDTITSFISTFIRTAEKIIQCPCIAVGQLSLIDESEQERVIEEFNNVNCDYPNNITVAQAFEQQVSKTPNHLAVAADGEMLTYKELDDLSNQFAWSMHKKGVAVGDMAALYCKKDIEMIAAMIGILKIGAAYVPIDTHYPIERVGYILEDCKPKVIISNLDLSDEFKDIEILDNKTKYYLDESTKQFETAGGANSLAYVIYTSGTTGKPKGSMIENKSILRLVKNINYIKLDENTVMLQTGSVAFDAATFEFWGVLLNGGELHLAADDVMSDVGKLKKSIENNNVNTLWLTTSLFNYMIGADGSVFNNLDYLLTGGEVISLKHVRIMKTYNKKTTLINCYGPTEGTTFTTAYEVPDDFEEIPIGGPISNTNVYVINQFGKLCGINMPGELYVAGDGIARGYLNKPELTKEKFIDNYYGTGKMYSSGDLVKWNKDGMIRFIGRIDEQVKIRGFRVELAEIENALNSLDTISNATLIVNTNNEGYKYIAAYLVSHKELVFSDIRNKLAAILPSYMIPSHFMQIDEIPMNRNGKVDRKALPKIEIKSEVKYVAPENEKEQILVSVYEEILGLDCISTLDNFFQVGGDSIKAIRIASKVREAGYTVAIKDIMYQENIKFLAEHMQEYEKIIYEQGEVTGIVPLTPIQKTFYNMQYDNPDYYNQAVMIKFASDPNVEAINAALKKLAEHHDMLRMVLRDNEQLILSCDESKLYELHLFDIGEMKIDEENIEYEIENRCVNIQKSMNLNDGPLIKAALFKVKENESHMMIAIHHIAVDAVSWRILIEDLISGYRQHLNGEDIQLAEKTASFKQWANLMQEYSNSDEVLNLKEYWDKVLDIEYKYFHDFEDVDIEEGQDVIADYLTYEETQQLLFDVNKTYNTEIQDVLLTALMEVIAEYSDNDTIIVQVESHGREEMHKPVDVDRTVGWFTNVYPVLLEKKMNLGDSIISVKESLRKIQKNGIGYGAYLLNREKAVPKAEISFNYLGEIDNEINPEWGIEISNYRCGSTSASENQMNNILSVDISVVNKQLKLELFYDYKRISRSTTEKLGSIYVDTLKQIIKYCCNSDESFKTLSDVGASDMELDDLEMLNTLV